MISYRLSSWATVKVQPQLVTGTYNTVITSFIAPGSYLYLTNMDCDYASGASWAFGNVGAGNPLGFWE